MIRPGTRHKPPGAGQPWFILTAVVVVLLILAPVAAEETTSHLSFSQITFGASSGQSDHYGYEDTITFATAEVTGQSSSNYTVKNPLAVKPLANNGLAQAVGTIMTVSWPPAGMPGMQGYDVWRSTSGKPGTYIKINNEAVTITQYKDRNLEKGTYYYVIFYLDGEGRPIQWTGPIIGVITQEPSSVDDWTLYP
jgi:hypothetical protein